MIIGIGLELCSIERVRRAVDRYGVRFVRKVCPRGEWTDLQERNIVESLSARLAAKIALRKVLGPRPALRWKDVYVKSDENGKPQLVLVRSGLEAAHAAGANRWLVSLSHEADIAAALIVLERV